MKRKHIKEMIRFTESKVGTKVWLRHKDSNNWTTTLVPTWREDTFYVVDDKYAELRKKSIDTGRPVQIYNMLTSEWEIPAFEIQFDGNLANYKLEPEQEFKYPIYKKDKNSSLVIKFTGLKDGVVVKGTSIYSVGYMANDWFEHTNTEEWEDIDYKEPIYYYQWEKLYPDGMISISEWVTDEYARSRNYEKQGWRKIESSRRTWED